MGARPTAYCGFLILLEVVVHEAHHERRLNHQLARRTTFHRIGSAYLSDSCFAQKYQLHAATRLRLRGCVRHCEVCEWAECGFFGLSGR